MKQHPKHQARVVALQGLYLFDVQRQPADDAALAELVEPWLAEANVAPEIAAYTRELCREAWSRHEGYDQVIRSTADHWDVGRMAIVDRNILRMALYELIERPDVPARVVIDEAIELGREFGAAETPHFINGVLDAIWKHDPACELARTARDARGTGTSRKGEEKHGTV